MTPEALREAAETYHRLKEESFEDKWAFYRIIQEASQTMGPTQIAKLTGLSKQRIAQITRLNNLPGRCKAQIDAVTETLIAKGKEMK